MAEPSVSGAAVSLRAVDAGVSGPVRRIDAHAAAARAVRTRCQPCPDGLPNKKPLRDPEGFRNLVWVLVSRQGFEP